MTTIIMDFIRRLLGVKSPSKECLKEWAILKREFMIGFKRGFARALLRSSLAGFQPETFDLLQRSADALTWGDDE